MYPLGKWAMMLRQWNGDKRFGNYLRWSISNNWIFTNDYLMGDLEMKQEIRVKLWHL